MTVKGNTPGFSVSTEAPVARGVKFAAETTLRSEVVPQGIGDVYAALHIGIR
ncbi:hypothetical protein [Streptomyces sp. ADI98-10]|uniref:hypothetical protein n=1 Tax=Streptomyces sp. ADI98-10 TaxID=1522763 RepID=UPI0013DE727C|nr:hypothetical protein [Streptomyces sp. ADI98-10]